MTGEPIFNDNDERVQVALEEVLILEIAFNPFGYLRACRHIFAKG
jgi:hypothetical protein